MVCPPNTLLVLLLLLVLGVVTVTVFSTGVAFCTDTKEVPGTDTVFSLVATEVGLVMNVVGVLMALVGKAVTTLAVVHVVADPLAKV